jgi:hypothetical protein
VAVLRSRKAPTIRVGAAVVSVAAAVTMVVFPSAAGAVPVPWRNCGSPSEVVNIQEFNASIWPPVAGERLVLAYRGTVGETIPYATQTVQLSVGQKSVSFTAPFALPSSAANEERFPIFAGPFDADLYFKVPKWLGGLLITMNVRATSSTGAPLICAELVVPIKT